MRILIYISKLGGGGAERVASLWANGFAERGNDVCIAVNRRCNNEYYIPKGINIVEVSKDTPIKFLRQLRQIKNIRTAVKKFNPDVIITVLYPCGEYAYIATRGLGIPIVNTEHNSFERPKSAPMTSQKKKAKFVENKKYNIVTVLTEADKRNAQGYLENIFVLPNPLAFIPAKSVPDKEKIILAAGRLDDWHYKGFDILINAWGKIARDYPEWKLQIAGTGSPRSLDYLKKIAMNMDVAKQVEFLGFCNDILPVYQRSSIFILSSRYEGFGMVLIEAMSQGCACIACDYNGRQREIIQNNDEGVICEPDNEEELASAIKSLIDNRNLRKNVQEGGIARSYNYSLDSIMKRWEIIINKL